MSFIATRLGLSVEAVAVLVVLLGVMAVTTLSRLLRLWIHPSRDAIDLLSRVGGWWALVVGLIVALAAAPLGPMLFALGLSLVALHEYLRVTTAKAAAGLWPLAPAAYGLIVAHYGVMALGRPMLLMWLLPLAGPLVLAGVLILARRIEGFTRALAVTYLGIMLTGYALSHVAMMMTVGVGRCPLGGVGPCSLGVVGDAGLERRVGWLLGFVLLVSLSDIAQAWTGKRLGGPKLSPVSPNKTWSGLIGGALATGLLAVALAPVLGPISLTDAGPRSPAVTDDGVTARGVEQNPSDSSHRFHPWRYHGRPISMTAWVAVAACLGALISVVGLLSDLMISALKRDAGVKDSGTLLGDQGGVLDRIDSMLLTAPLFYHGILPLLASSG